MSLNFSHGKVQETYPCNEKVYGYLRKSALQAPLWPFIYLKFVSKCSILEQIFMNQLRHQTSPRNISHHIQLSTRWRILKSLKNVTKVSSKTTIKVPASSITPTVSLGNTSYTSYDKYAGPDAGNGISKLINGDKSQGTIGANDCQPETLYAPSVVIGGIHTNLLTNSNYSKKIAFYLDSGSQNAKTDEYSTPEISGNTFRGKDFTSLSWGSHTLTASFTFEGIPATFNGSKIHHITGLPYKPTQMVESDWTFSSWNCKYSSGVIQLGGVSGSGRCTATSNMQFKIPQTVDITVNTNVTVRDYYLVLWYKTTFTIKVNGTTIITQAGNKQDNNNTGKNYNLSGNSSLKSNEYSIEMNSSYETAGPWSKVHSLHILYR